MNLPALRKTRCHWMPATIENVLGHFEVEVNVQFTIERGDRGDWMQPPVGDTVDILRVESVEHVPCDEEATAILQGEDVRPSLTDGQVETLRELALGWAEDGE